MAAALIALNTTARARETSSSRFKTAGSKASRTALLHAIKLNPLNLDAYSNLANTMDADERVQLPDGSKRTRRELLKACMDVHHADPAPHPLLSCDMRPEECLHLDAGVRVGKQEMLIRAVELNPHQAHVFNNLGAALQPGQRVQLNWKRDCVSSQIAHDDHADWDAKALFLRAIDLQPDLAEAYANIALLLQAGEKITLPVLRGGDNGGIVRQSAATTTTTSSHDNSVIDGIFKSRDNFALPVEQWCARSLLAEAIRLDGSVSLAFSSLAEIIGREDGQSACVQLSDGRYWAPKELYARAIELDEMNITAFEGLGHLLGSDEWVRLEDGSTWTRRQLLARALTLRRWRWKSHDPLTKERWWRNANDENGGAAARRIPMASPSRWRAVAPQ